MEICNVSRSNTPMCKEDTKVDVSNFQHKIKNLSGMWLGEDLIMDTKKTCD